MRHTRRITAIGLFLIFCIALVIGAGIILSVRNVNVSIISYSESTWEEEYEKTRSNLSSLKGSGLLFIDDDDILSKVSDTEVLSVESVEKVFPCTVNVVLRERQETFASFATSGYTVYDEKGEVIKTSVISSSVPLSSADDSPVVLVEAKSESAVTSHIAGVASLCSYFKEEFGSLRRMVESVSVVESFENAIYVINLRSGLSIYFGAEYSDVFADGMKAVYGTYSTLSSTQKLSGRITVSVNSSNTPSAVYSN